jgi:serine/threonine-protein phosphatase Stp1
MSAGDTHRGLVRESNEDAFLLRPEVGLWAVADGIGGLARGAAASAAVMDCLRDLRDGGDFAGRIAQALSSLNDRLVAESQHATGRAAMGSTVTALTCDNHSFVCLWVGDSRLYRYRGGVVEQMTSDHTPVQEMIDAGLLDRNDRSVRGLDHVLNRAVGIKAPLELGKLAGPIQPGDVFLLCTDGLSKAVGTEIIGDSLAEPDPARAVRLLIEAALAHGGPDNVTAVIVHTGSAPRHGAGAVSTQARQSESWPDSWSIGDGVVPPAPAIPLPPHREPQVISVRHHSSEWSLRLGILGILLTLLVGFVGFGGWLTSIEARLTQAAVGMIPAPEALEVMHARLRFLLCAGFLFQGGAWLGFAGRRLPTLIALSVLVIFLGLAVATIGASDAATAFTIKTALPSVQAHLSRFLHSILNEVQSWLQLR